MPDRDALEPARAALAAAFAHHRNGQAEDAGRQARAALALMPDHPAPRHLLAQLAAEAGDWDAAAEQWRALLDRDPADVVALNNLGNLLQRQGRLGEAVALYRAALERRPGAPEVQVNLGSALRRLGDPEAAEAAYRQALTLRPDDAGAWHGLGLALLDQGRPGDAAEALAAALRRRPGDSALLADLGGALADLGRLDEASALLDQALAHDPDRAETHNSRGTVHQRRGDVGAAIGAYRRAVALRPDYAGAQWNLALALLLTGDLAQGFAGYRWRWRLERNPARGFAQPAWDGEPLAGRTVLLHAEQGIGDTVQMLRYVPLVAARGGRVVVEVPPPLARLAASLPDCTVAAAGGALPPFDCHVPLLDLPRCLGTTIDTIPAAVPYLAPEPEDVARWSARIGGGAGPAVGLVWAGNPAHANDRNRSLPAEALAPLLAVPGVRWFSLQVGPRAGELARRGGAGVTGLGADLNDFAETAAALTALDLVITVDTAVAHLAGALARPAWVLLAHAPDWRWLLGRDDSPWYPTLRLFRQPRPGDWEKAILDLTASLKLSLQA